MQQSVSRAFGCTSLHVGDLAWLSRQHSHRQLSLDIRLWEDAAAEADGGRPAVAWSYYRANGEFNVFAVPGFGSPALFDALLDEIEAAARASVEAGDPPADLTTYGVDLSRSAEDRELAAALERRGFRVDAGPAGAVPPGVLRRMLEDVVPPALPPGYRLGWVEDRARVIGRVEAHRAAFAPSELTVRQYERVQRAWPYRPDLDRVALTERGDVAAFCTAWLDEVHAAGLLEPVGTHPAHRRRGLGRAVVTDALLALRAAGARTAQIGFGSDAAYATYRSAGFQRHATELIFAREAGG
jgi:ribosomal protein S18 acetylase RimI-like enzyme